MTDSLRAKQNMEILDVFKNIHSQVVGLQNKQVQQFPESLKAKTQRDLGAEVNVDKAVENINKTIEGKLGALEFVVQNINPENRGAEGAEELTTQANRNTFYNSLSQVNNTGDVIPLWNAIVRAYQDKGVNRETQQVIKVKVQELTPNLEAVVYGINQAIDTIFEKKIVKASFAGTILELLHEAVFGEQHHLLKQGFSYGPINAPLGGAFNEKVLVFFHFAFLLFAHRPPQQVGLT